MTFFKTASSLASRVSAISFITWFFFCPSKYSLDEALCNTFLLCFYFVGLQLLSKMMPFFLTFLEVVLLPTYSPGNTRVAYSDGLLYSRWKVVMDCRWRLENRFSWTRQKLLRIFLFWGNRWCVWTDMLIMCLKIMIVNKTIHNAIYTLYYHILT